MTDREQKIAEIREALEKATPGPWKWIDPGGRELKKLVGEWEIMNFGVSAPYSEIAGQEPDDNDAHLIANAPEWLRFLLSELDKRDKLIDVLKGLVQEFYQVSNDLYRNKWKKEGDMFAQGQSDAFDTAAQRLEATLKECGVTVE